MNELKDTYKGTLILHIAMVMGPALFMGVAYFINNLSGSPIAGGFEDMSQTFQYIAYGITIVGYFGSSYFFKNSLASAKQEEQLIDKLSVFRSANVMQTALLEGPALISLCFYLLTNAPVFMLIAGMLLVYMLLKLPVQSKISDDLELTQAERKEFSNALSS